MTDSTILEGIGDYKYGFRDPDTFVFKSRKGLNHEVVREISLMKDEPEWMLEYR
jgi:Fe-S cluster assembly protein SufB